MSVQQDTKVRIEQVNSAGQGQFGFMVAGYIGKVLTPDTTRTIPVLAESEDEAVSSVVETYPDFVPIGCMSEAQLQEHLDLITELRSQNA